MGEEWKKNEFQYNTIIKVTVLGYEEYIDALEAFCSR